MSTPFVIWTMQRTGGTTLTTLLKSFSEYPSLQHEPFNVERKLGWILQNWGANRDTAKMQSDISAALSDRPIIKHCYELVPEALNLALMKATSELGYRHIILDRRAEDLRILSLELAKQTGAWGKTAAEDVYRDIKSGEKTLAPLSLQQALDHLDRCHTRRLSLAKQMKESGLSPLVVHFEDVYTDPIAGKKRVREILSFVELNPLDFQNGRQRVAKALRTQGQNTESIMDLLPNLSVVKDKLQTAQKSQSFNFETCFL
ncbi:hypothetical protein [Shimia sagamensis]|uniref:Stf0 sulfotransferase n=1 Tax=Shimia sagamensis TaxID=1566352 RepID=A0ABY1NB77_9RHOB|nr:hypothetical protein [Shimia sagamensis]SMP05492.1 hypothetical protein SAMN06265373_101569 [Shimia sagamensis]